MNKLLKCSMLVALVLIVTCAFTSSVMAEDTLTAAYADGKITITYTGAVSALGIQGISAVSGDAAPSAGKAGEFFWVDVPASGVSFEAYGVAEDAQVLYRRDAGELSAPIK
jgi:hypothetical protein